MAGAAGTRRHLLLARGDEKGKVRAQLRELTHLEPEGGIMPGCCCVLLLLRLLLLLLRLQGHLVMLLRRGHPVVGLSFSHVRLSFRRRVITNGFRLLLTAAAAAATCMVDLGPK